MNSDIMDRGKLRTWFLLIAFSAWGHACESPRETEASPVVKTGIEVLREEEFELLKGKRVGLITNPTGVDASLIATADLLHEHPEVELVALYGPEHGIRGNYSAGDRIQAETDIKTGLPVFSLYGENRKPTKEMLRGVDVLVYDIQDIGVRSYTYISTMGLAMEVAAENGIDFVVLDRPNPLGGEKVEGPIVEEDFFSFVGAFPIPYVYGLTTGELARFLNEEKLLENGVRCELSVVPMKGWKRTMTFEETGLKWVPPSPHIPKASSSYYYAISGIAGELDPNMIGVGYTLPFEVFVLPWLDAEQLKDKMEGFGFEGVHFRPIYFKPYYMHHKGTEYAGVQVYVDDFSKIPLTEIQFRFLEAAHDLEPDSSVMISNKHRFGMFDKVTGNPEIRQTFMKNYDYEDIRDLWEKDAAAFKERSRKYYLYF